MSIGYEIEVGSTTFSSDASAGHVLSIESQLGVGGSVGECMLQFGDVSWADPQLGDPVHVRIDSGDGPVSVFTGELERICQRPDALWIRAQDGLAKLARSEVEGAYEEVAAGVVFEDLVTQAGATAGEIEDGPTFSSYVVHRGPRALRHAQRLAERVGAELSSDGEGNVHFRFPQQDSAVQSLVWGEHLVEISLQARALVRDSFSVRGEGAAGTDGAARGHWLPTELAGVSGEASVTSGAPGEVLSVAAGSSGELVRTVCDGALRSAEVAGDVAKARAQQIALRPMVGHVVALARPELQPGAWVELNELPGANEQSRTLTLRVRRVLQQLTYDGGFVTRLEF